MSQQVCLKCLRPLHPHTKLCEVCDTTEQPKEAVTDLEHITTEDLIDELIDRCDSLVLAYDPKSNKKEQIKFVGSGAMNARIGLVYMLKNELERNSLNP